MQKLLFCRAVSCVALHPFINSKDIGFTHSSPAGPTSPFVFDIAFLKHIKGKRSLRLQCAVVPFLDPGNSGLRHGHSVPKKLHIVFHV